MSTFFFSFQAHVAQNSIFFFATVSYSKKKKITTEKPVTEEKEKQTPLLGMSQPTAEDDDSVDVDVDVAATPTKIADKSVILSTALTTAGRLAATKQPRPSQSVKAVKGAKGLAKLGAKRHEKKLRDNIQGVTAAALRRLARRGGVKRLGMLVYEETRLVLKVFLSDVIREAIVYSEHANRKTVLTTDVVHALRRRGHTLYGYGN